MSADLTATSPLAATDPEIWNVVQQEQGRQTDGLELIASENYTSAAILEAAGTVLTNKYAEGYPGRRYYGGCEFVDVAESLARDRACQLFGAEHANVQPHAGSQANMAVYMSVLKPGDTFLAMNLAHGGHLTHGMHLNFSGQLYNAVHYGVREDDHRIDFDQVAKLAREHKPALIVAGASAYPREIEHPRFAEIAEEVGAKLMVDMAHYSGWSPPASTTTRSRWPTSSPRRRTRRCGARVPEWSSAASSTQRISTRRSSPACRADR